MRLVGGMQKESIPVMNGIIYPEIMCLLDQMYSLCCVILYTCLDILVYKFSYVGNVIKYAAR